MKYVEYIPNLWFRFRAIAQVFLRKITYSFSGRDLKVIEFKYEAANKKGLLSLKYQCEGLLYLEVVNKKYFNLSGTIILNLEKVGNDIPLEISFIGRRSKVIEKIVINDGIHTKFARFRTEINVKKLEMQDLKLAQNKKTLRYSLSNTAITIKSPKLKFR